TDFDTTECRVADGYSFEPRDAVKGDSARAAFYMAVRYEGNYEGVDVPTLDLELVEAIPSLLGTDGLPTNGAHISNPQFGKLSTLLQWHSDDPPDAKEVARNDIIFRRFQGNRNPFVDHPEWAGVIWGSP
ncbi:endonuclease, partial [Myxococcota bacterium]|nr:endonuclease [Myxococcota bacterium]